MYKSYNDLRSLWSRDQLRIYLKATTFPLLGRPTQVQKRIMVKGLRKISPERQCYFLGRQSQSEIWWNAVDFHRFNSGCNCSRNYFVFFPPRCHLNCTIIATNLAVWLANLPLSIRVQTTLLASMCHALGHALKKNFFDVDIVVKTNRMFSVVRTFIDNDMHHHSGPNLLYTETTLNHIRLMARPSPKQPIETRAWTLDITLHSV